MKTTEEIIRRAVCLLLFTDRCWLEEEILDGIHHSLDEREEQRKKIKKWLIDKDYYGFLSKKEKMVIDNPVIERNNIMILAEANDYECIEPLLWSVGLVPELSSYNYFVTDDLHPPLKIGRNHSLKDVVNVCKPISSELIEKNREMAMLWYWRCLECRNHSHKTTNYLEAIGNVFGDKYVDYLQNYSGFSKRTNDFMVNGKKVSSLSNKKIAELTVYSEKRFYAFEWMRSDYDWENVDLVC